MNDDNRNFKFILMVSSAGVILLILSAIYLTQEIGTNLLLEKTAFSIAGVGIPVWLVALFLSAFWFYLFAKIFLARNSLRLHRLLITIDEICNRIEELQRSNTLPDPRPFRKMRLTRIILMAREIIQLVPLGQTAIPGVHDSRESPPELWGYLAEDVEWISYSAIRIFGIAGGLAGLSLLCLYMFVSPVPITIVSYKALILIIGGYWFGGRIGYQAAQYSHRIFPFERLCKNNGSGGFGIMTLARYKWHKFRSKPIADEEGMTIIPRQYGIGIDIPEAFYIKYYDRAPLKVYFSRKNGPGNAFGGMQLYRTLVPKNYQENCQQTDKLFESLKGINVLQRSHVHISGGSIQAYLVEYESHFGYKEDNFISELAQQSNIQGAKSLRIARYFFYHPKKSSGSIAFCSTNPELSPLDADEAFSQIIDSLCFVDYVNA